MRLRKLNRLVMVAVSSTLAGMTASISGCKHRSPPTSMHLAPGKPAVTSPARSHSVVSSTVPTTGPTTNASTTSAIPAPPAVVSPTTEATSQPTTAATSQPTTDATSQPTTAPATQAATQPNTAAIPEAATQPVVAIPPSAPSPTTASSAGGNHEIAVMPTTAPAVVPAAPIATTAPIAPATQPMTSSVPIVAPVPMPPTNDAPPSTAPEEIEGDAALAEQIASIAELSFPKVSNTDAWPFLWRQQAALYGAATALNPTESRYARLTADADAQLHDLDGEIKALYLATRAKPDDEFSWNKRLDLLLSRMESAEADVKSQTAEVQVKYLRAVMDSKLVPSNVRAHAGFRTAQILLDRGQDAAAATVLDEALRYGPSSIECLKLRYAMLPRTATRFERVGRLLDLLRANPLQWHYSAQVADLAAASGLVQQSIPWYLITVTSAHQQGNAAQGPMLDLAAALYITDRKPDSARTVAALLQIDPKFYPAWFLELVLSRSTGDKEALAKTLQLATNVFSNRIVEVINQVAPTATNQPTTRPITSPGAYPLPDLTPVVAKLNTDGSAQSKQSFVEAVADLARLKIYFADQPEGVTALLESLHSVLPENDPLLAQLQGWNAIMANKPDEARSKLASIAAQDPLAQLGLIKLLSADPQTQEQAESLARKLMQDNPSGILGAMIAEGLRSERVKLVLTSQAVALQQEISQFPADLLNVGEKPQSVYSIHATPVGIGRYIGDPLIAQIMIQNMTDKDLTVGDDGVIKPQLLFTMTAKLGEKPMEFRAIDNLACPTVIKPHMYSQQTVRVDQSQMLGFLSDRESTNIAFAITGVVSTNETAYHLGGYASPFTKAYYRKASPVTPGNLEGMMASIATAQPAQKITSLNLLELFVQKLQKMTTPDGAPNKAVPVLMDSLHKARADTIPAVAAWASKTEFDLAEGDNQVGILRDMIEDSDWRHRQVALSLLSRVDGALQQQVLKKLSQDPQSTVRAQAIAIQGLMEVPDKGPATAPTAAP